MVRWGASEGDIWGDEEKENHVYNEGKFFFMGNRGWRLGMQFMKADIQSPEPVYYNFFQANKMAEYGPGAEERIFQFFNEMQI